MKPEEYVTTPEKVQAIQLKRDNFNEVVAILLDYGYTTEVTYVGDEATSIVKIISSQ